MPFESRFGPAASFYSAFRPEYPAELYEKIFAALAPSQFERAMDLGAGTGKSTRSLAVRFHEVIAVEPDPLMVEKLRATAPQAIVRVTSAEDCVQLPESLDLIIIATALHWMDGPRVMANVLRWLRQSGILAVFGDDFPHTPRPVSTIVRKEFDERWTKFRDSRLRREGFPQCVVEEAPGLRVIDRRTVNYSVPLTPRQFVGFCHSTSFGSAYAAALPDPDSYWLDLESQFRQAWPEEKFPVDFSPWLIIARKE